MAVATAQVRYPVIIAASAIYQRERGVSDLACHPQVAFRHDHGHLVSMGCPHRHPGVTVCGRFTVRREPHAAGTVTQAPVIGGP